MMAKQPGLFDTLADTFIDAIGYIACAGECELKFTKNITED